MVSKNVPELNKYLINGSYDIDAYAVDMGLDRLGLYTPAYRHLIESDIDIMQAHNSHMTPDGSERSTRWLALFVSVAALVCGMLGTLSPVLVAVMG
jgi:hypothetical protein